MGDAIVALTFTVADGQVTRRRAVVGELAALCEPEQPELARQVVEAFAAARLMVTGPLTPVGPLEATPAGAAEALSGAPAPPAAGTVELVHDVLVSAWPRLRSWLAEDQADRVLHGEILQDAAEWDGACRDASFLYRGIRLDSAHCAATRWHADPGRYLGLTGPAEAFLHADTRAATRTRRRWQAVFSVPAGLLVIAVVTAVAAVRFGQDVDRQRELALIRSDQSLWREKAAYSQSLSNDSAASARFAAAAWAIARTDDARVSMAALLSQPARAVLAGHTDSVRSVVFSTDDTRMVSAGADNVVRIWDVALPPDLLRAVCGIAGRGFTAQEWQRYIPEAPYRPSCPHRVVGRGGSERRNTAPPGSATRRAAGSSAHANAGGRPAMPWCS